MKWWQMMAGCVCLMTSVASKHFVSHLRILLAHKATVKSWGLQLADRFLIWKPQQVAAYTMRVRSLQTFHSPSHYWSSRHGASRFPASSSSNDRYQLWSNRKSALVVPKAKPEHVSPWNYCRLCFFVPYHFSAGINAALEEWEVKREKEEKKTPESGKEPCNEEIGRTILSRSFVGSQRYYMDAYYVRLKIHTNLPLHQDAMELVRVMGRPTLFITLTANTHWKEITENLRFTQEPIDRPELVARVFDLKAVTVFWTFQTQKQLEQILKENEIFGPVRALVKANESQKRGLYSV